MDKTWPVKDIRFGKCAHGVWQKVNTLINSGEVFALRYNSDDDKSVYVYLNSYDGKSKTLKCIIKKCGLNVFTPHVRNGELLLVR